MFFVKIIQDPSIIPLFIKSILSILFSRYERTSTPVVFSLLIKIAWPLKVNAVLDISSFKVHQDCLDLHW